MNSENDVLNPSLNEDVPLEVLFKYLLRDYRKLQVKFQQLEIENNLVNKQLEKLNIKLANVNAHRKNECAELRKAILSRNNTIKLLRDENEHLNRMLAKYELYIGDI